MRLLQDIPSRLKGIFDARRNGGDAGPYHGRRVWLLGLAVFLTSVAIGSILPRDPVTSVPAVGQIARPPPMLLAPDSDVPVEQQPLDDAAPDAAAPADMVSGVGADVWKTIAIRRGDTLTSILKREGHDDADIARAMQSQPAARALFRLTPGKSLQVRVDMDGALRELIYPLNQDESVRLLRSENGLEATRETRRLETRTARVTGVIETSLFEAGQEAGLSDAVIMKLVEIFGWDIDFALDLRRGDSFAVVYEEKFWLGQKAGDGAVLAAEFVNQGKVYRAAAHRGPDGATAYYTPEGLSLRREFLRTPVKFSRITSRFTRSPTRYHPILKRWTAHTGVDYGAPAGTPVRTTASGRVLFVGANGGYGKMVLIRHGSDYSTLYAHLSRFQPGIRPGGYVEQGQVIGFVGSTGLATGPHLHYEFQVKGIHRNPLTYKSPGAAPIAAQYREEFLRGAHVIGAQLDVISRNALAASSR
ncbi:MAG: hypothetical protein A3B81_06000 [Candidatus Muproteobacteria bacterium RIFCSPHIGHO2_02_FULL_65_16]|uniref:Uncharacterized protein n=1 Tax=Candidatus Muproteobacteria bacterium RIFCSPHIGHO2_02_FULL_65_16 TaxID=1817766 RepID=A0A1F6TXI9_9PROT|nr:MAG: hypothetical protein A3B81_06000 [Candidatus Muproteobacteria bacterium RIFCSPHIGHO2_02_FULL_65_16]